MSVLSSADTLLQYWKSSISWSAADYFFPRGSLAVNLVLLESATKNFNSEYTKLLFCPRFWHSVITRPFWIKVKHKVYSGIKDNSMMLKLLLLHEITSL